MLPQQNLVVIEGLDKVGKSTLISKLTDHPDFQNSAFYNFPSFKFDYLRKLTKDFDNTTPYLRDLAHALSHGMTYIDMQQYFETKDWIICDRYYYSSLVYSDESKMKYIENLWMDPVPPIPSIIFYLYSCFPYPKFASSRGDEDPNDSMDPELRKEINELYFRLFTSLEKTQKSKFIAICVDDRTPEYILNVVISNLNNISNGNNKSIK